MVVCLRNGPNLSHYLTNKLLEVAGSFASLRMTFMRNVIWLLIALSIFALSSTQAQTLAPAPAVSPTPSPEEEAIIPTFETQKLARTDRKSTRLNSSHGYISYAVFCLK